MGLHCLLHLCVPYWIQYVVKQEGVVEKIVAEVLSSAGRKLRGNGV